MADNPYIVYGQNGILLSSCGGRAAASERTLRGKRPPGRRGPCAGQHFAARPGPSLADGRGDDRECNHSHLLADSHPVARLSPPLDDPRRPAFLRWMSFVSAQIYTLVCVPMMPCRLSAEAAHGEVILTASSAAHCLLLADNRFAPGKPWPLHPRRENCRCSICTCYRGSLLGRRGTHRGSIKRHPKWRSVRPVALDQDLQARRTVDARRFIERP